MYIKVYVTASAKKEKFAKLSDTHFEISVKEKAQQNLANRRVIDLVSAHFRIPARATRIISGHRSRSKIISIPD